MGEGGIQGAYVQDSHLPSVTWERPYDMPQWGPHVPRAHLDLKSVESGRVVYTVRGQRLWLHPADWVPRPSLQRTSWDQPHLSGGQHHAQRWDESPCRIRAMLVSICPLGRNMGCVKRVSICCKLDTLTFVLHAYPKYPSLCTTQ